MKNGLARIEELGSFDEIIDVRTPEEFADDHIPGARNCPVLDNAQRIEVGTLYKQTSPFAAKKIGAAYVSENIARYLRDTFIDRPKNWRPLIVCWRGGERSAAMTHVFRRIGWNAHQLEGGYKAYRAQVIAELASLPAPLDFRVVCGATGSGKSRVLQALHELGEQVLDLEALACHKGSVLGVLPDTAQPSQRMFESRLRLGLLSFDPARPVYIEAESRKIGTLQLPDALLQRIQNGPCLIIEAEFAARIDFLLRDYDYFLHAPQWLNSRLDSLFRILGRETIGRWQEYALHGKWRELVGELLEQHYDPQYRRSQQRDFSRLQAARKFVCADLEPASIGQLARRIIDHVTPDKAPQETPSAH